MSSTVWRKPAFSGLFMSIGTARPWTVTPSSSPGTCVALTWGRTAMWRNRSESGDEAQRRAVVVRDRLASDTGCEQHPLGVGQAETPAVAGVRNDADVAGARVRLRRSDDARERGARPALLRVEAARAVERRNQLVVGADVRQRP